MTKVCKMWPNRFFALLKNQPHLGGILWRTFFYILKECIILNPAKNADSHESYQSYYRP